MIKVAINGFGRIGRATFKAILERTKLEIVAINDLTDTKTLAHLLKYDSVYGKYDKEVSYTDKSLVIEGNNYPVFAEKDPANLPWKKLSVGVVIESTGRFTTIELASAHLKAGAKKVVISAPPKGGGIGTFVLGVNDGKITDQKIISNASCTTNCIAPVAQIIQSKFGIKKATMTTVHAYTADQNLVDGPHEDLRRARAAALNIVPTTTGAATATTETIPELKGIFDGLSVRVPTPVVSLSDFTFLLKKKVTAEEVNNAFREAKKKPQYKDIIDLTEEPIVSTDLIGNSYSSIIDLPLTKVIDGDLLKVVAWYDNEWGYSCRLAEIVELVGSKLKT